jgi:TRAP-type C4-dicarboxylate transport system permease small subunit
MNLLARFQKAVNAGAHALQMIAGVAIFLTSVAVTVNAVARYGLNRDIAILTEAGGFMFLLVIFFGLAGTFAAGSHVSVEILSVIVPKRIARFMYDIVVPILAMVFIAVLLVAGTMMTLRFYANGRMTIGMFPLPFWVFMAIVPIGCVAMELALVSSLIDGLRRLTRAGKSSAADHDVAA